MDFSSGGVAVGNFPFSLLPWPRKGWENLFFLGKRFPSLLTREIFLFFSLFAVSALFHLFPSSE